MNSQLLCTFTTKESLEIVLSEIVSSYEIIFDKIYVLQNEEQVEELMCTYNVDSTNAVDYNAVDNTISLHRKKFTNTLYTINALNEVIAELNNGIVDSKFLVPWENFKNTLLVTNSEGLNKINTRIIDAQLNNSVAREVSCRPNTGYLAIFDILAHSPSKLSIYGFSFYLDGFIKNTKAGISGMSEDDFKIWSDEIQDITDLSISCIDKIVVEKQQDILKV